MIDLSSILSPTSPAAASPAAGAVASSGTFGETLGAFLDANDAPGATIPPDARQGLADDGKDLPDPDDADDEPDTNAVPPWFAVFAPLTNTPVAPRVSDACGDIVAGARLPATAPFEMETPPTLSDDVATMARPKSSGSRAAPTALALPAFTMPSVTTLQPSTPAVSTDPRTTTAVAPTLDAILAQAAGRASTPTSKPTPTSNDDAPKAAVVIARDAGQTIAVSTTPQPAAQVFAGAIAAATSWRERARGEGDADGLATPVPTAAPTDIRNHVAVPATGDVQNSALDLTRDTGLQTMIDRIETLRDELKDGADARDTRIRLTPDALGSVDIAVRRDGERVAVNFTAEHEATRALIADAQPRLTELAAARGVRIGDTSVGTGSGTTGGNGGGGTQQQPQPHVPAPFIRAPMMPSEDAIPTDRRLA